MKTMIRHLRRIVGRNDRTMSTAQPQGKPPAFNAGPGSGVFVRQRPWVPSEPFWCTVTAYYSSGQPLRLWSSGARDVRLAARELQRQVHRLAAQLGLEPGTAPVAWLDSRGGMGRAMDDLAAGRSHAVTFTHDLVTYVLAVEPSDGSEPRLPGRGVPCPA
ncbi:hypothetical protein ACWEQL_34730 [Kitasatospora sp. NPDC004240]